MGLGIRNATRSVFSRTEGVGDMFWRFFHHTVSCVLTVAVFVASSAAARAQFVDLDDTAANVETSSTAADGELLDLTPTTQPFLAPESPIKVAARTQEPAAGADEGLAPIVHKQRLSAAKPEPIPMPELQEQVSPQPEREVKEVETVAVQPTPVSTAKVEPDVLKPEANSSEPLDAFDKLPSSSSSQEGPALEAAKFKTIQPGVSTKAELVKAWGEPIATGKPGDQNSSRLVYQMPSFRQIDVSIDEDDLVSGIVVHLTEAKKISHINNVLGIGRLVAVPIPDEYGEILGQAYPERGLLLGFADGLKSLRVSTILLEPLSAEMFRLRAQYDFGHHYERSLADLEQAVKLNPKDAESYWLRAQYMDLMGQTVESMKSVQKAIRLKPTDARYRLTRARLYAKTNRIRTGMDEVQEVIRELDLPAELAGRAHNLLGDMYAIGRKADHQQALKHHLKAIDFAVKVVSDERFAVRRAAKHVLVNAHGSIARDIAMGNFQRQSEVVPKWLLRATEMADEFISDDQGDDLLQMQIFRDTLASYAELASGGFDASIAIDEALKTGRAMIGKSSDRYYEIQVERMLAESLFHAAKIQRHRGEYDTALKFANNALALLDASRAEWDLVAHDHYLEAQLLFLAGSVYAVRDNNHFEAVDYYEKARRLLANAPGFTSPLYSDRSHGEMYVSMGLSYWETDEQDEAMQLTLQGATIMKDAVEDGTLKLEAMAVPYGNLAAMHSERGNSSKSQEFAELVAKIDEMGSKLR